MWGCAALSLVVSAPYSMSCPALDSAVLLLSALLGPLQGCPNIALRGWVRLQDLSLLTIHRTIHRAPAYGITGRPPTTFCATISRQLDLRKPPRSWNPLCSEPPSVIHISCASSNAATENPRNGRESPLKSLREYWESSQQSTEHPCRLNPAQHPCRRCHRQARRGHSSGSPRAWVSPGFPRVGPHPECCIAHCQGPCRRRREPRRYGPTPPSGGTPRRRRRHQDHLQHRQRDR